MPCVDEVPRPREGGGSGIEQVLCRHPYAPGAEQSRGVDCYPFTQRAHGYHQSGECLSSQGMPAEVVDRTLCIC